MEAENDTKYELELDRKQLATVREALELYSRLAMGQLSEATSSFIFPHFANDQLPVVQNLTDTLKEILLKLPVSSYHSLTSKEVPDKFRVAWDINQVIRHKLAGEEDPERKSWSVWHYTPERTAFDNVPLPRLRTVYKEKK